MTSMTLFSGPLSMFGAKVHIASLEKGLPVNVVMVPFTMEHRYDPKHPEVLRVNPKRQVSVLIHGDLEIFDSTQIFEYFEHLQPHPPRDNVAGDRDYIAGEYTYADIAFYMAQVFAARLGAPMTRATPRLLAWRERLTSRPAVHQVVLQFADSLIRYQLRVPDFIERAVDASSS